MKRDDRIALYESVIDTFLTLGKEAAFLTLEVLGESSEYAQFVLHDGKVYGEVGSRQWVDPEQPLAPDAVKALEALGFVGGGPERNYSCEGLPSDKHHLAELTDAALRTAYGLDDDFTPVVRQLNVNDVAPPPTAPLTRGRIGELLRGKQLVVLRDDDGDFRVDLTCPGSEIPVTVWFRAAGD